MKNIEMLLYQMRMSMYNEFDVAAKGVQEVDRSTITKKIYDYGERIVDVLVNEYNYSRRFAEAMVSRFMYDNDRYISGRISSKHVKDFLGKTDEVRQEIKGGVNRFLSEIEQNKQDERDSAVKKLQDDLNDSVSNVGSGSKISRGLEDTIYDTFASVTQDFRRAFILHDDTSRGEDAFEHVRSMLKDLSYNVYKIVDDNSKKVDSSLEEKLTGIVDDTLKSIKKEFKEGKEEKSNEDIIGRYDDDVMGLRALVNGYEEIAAYEYENEEPGEHKKVDPNQITGYEY